MPYRALRGYGRHSYNATIDGSACRTCEETGQTARRVRHFIFHPIKRKIVGFAVKRPDAALMFHRSDIFVALDGYSVVDGVVMINDDSQSTGHALASAWASHGTIALSGKVCRS